MMVGLSILGDQKSAYLLLLWYKIYLYNACRCVTCSSFFSNYRQQEPKQWFYLFLMTTFIVIQTFCVRFRQMAQCSLWVDIERDTHVTVCFMINVFQKMLVSNKTKWYLDSKNYLLTLLSSYWTYLEKFRLMAHKKKTVDSFDNYSIIY